MRNSPLVKPTNPFNRGSMLTGLILVVCLGVLGAGREKKSPQGFQAKVVGISDGDTITVLRGREEVKIRLHGVDSPEIGQAFGDAAKRYCSELAFGRKVTVIPVDTDRYGRTVARILLPHKRTLNAEMVKAGMAWWFRRYAPNDEELESLEAEARSQKRGLWSDPKAVPPFEYRHPESNVGEGMSKEDTAPAGSIIVYATKEGKCYHQGGCSALHGAGTTTTIDDALSRGLEPCKLCKPTTVTRARQ